MQLTRAYEKNDGCLLPVATHFLTRAAKTGATNALTMIPYYQSDPGTAANFINPQWIITPLPNNKWCLVCSGNLQVGFVTGNRPAWRADTIQISLELNSVFAYAGFHTPGKHAVLHTEQYACYGSLTSIFDKDTSVNAGFSVNKFYPYFSGGGRSLENNSGIFLDIATRDSDASLLRVGYYLMAIGTITEEQDIPVP